jgi:20S proteasome alpha/beta subunit
VALITDSRATWKTPQFPYYEDRLQKLLALDRKVGLAYAGDDIRIPEAVARLLRRRIAADAKRAAPERIVSVLPRIARSCYQEYVAKIGHRPPTSLILAGTNQSGHVLLYSFEAPTFVAQIPSEDFVVVGSGARVAEYLAVEMRGVDRSERIDLKVRVDRLLPGLEDALHRLGELTVGGMLQIVLVESRGIRPYTYWQIDLDPDQPPRARRMEMKAGRWTQTDLAANRPVPVVEPLRLLRAGLRPLRFQDFAPGPAERSLPKWHATYLLTCSETELRPGFARFGGLMLYTAAERYPIKLSFLVALGLWGTNGEHVLRVVLDSSSQGILLGEGTITLQHFPEPQDFVCQVRAEIQRPGPMFLTCYIDGQRLARRALFFAEIPLNKLSRDQATAELERRSSSCSDTELEERGGAELVYFTICQACRVEDAELLFEREFVAMYSRSYPVKIRAFAATALRLAAGKHIVRLEVVHAASGAQTTVSDTEIVSASSFDVARLHGEMPLPFSELGPHFVNVRVDGNRVASLVIHADDPDKPQSYSLRPSDVAGIKPGEHFVLVRRSMQAPHEVPGPPTSVQE